MSSPEFVASDVQQLRSSQGEELVTLLLYPAEGRDRLWEDIITITEGRGEVEEVGHAALRVTVSEYLVDDLCSINSLKSIDIERDAELLSGGQTGNSHSPSDFHQ